MATSVRHGARKEMRDEARSETRRSARALTHPPILIVDDDQDIRETLRIALEDEGYEVREAEDGARALSLLRQSSESLVVLLDLRLPRMTGDALLRRVNRKEHLPVQHTFLLVTASREQLSPVNLRLLQRMDVAIVAKPFDLNDLLDQVAHAADTIESAAI